MKKKIYLALFALMTVCFSNACEICGCGMGNYYIGFMPQFSHRFFGARYHFNKFHTRLLSDPSQFSDDFYQSVEIWGGWNFGQKWQMLAILPYNFNHQVSDEGIRNLKGFGDIAAIINYNVFSSNSKNSGNKRITQQLWLGAGIKLATGNFKIDATDPDVAAAANSQLGSGSTDFLLNAMYNLRIGKFGLNTVANYKINTANKVDYKFGNKLSAGAYAYYALSKSSVVFSPNIGVLYEHSGQSKLNDARIDLTGGSLVRGSLGMEVSFSRVSVGFNIEAPIAQNFAENQTKEKIKGMAHVSFSF